MRLHVILLLVAASSCLEWYEQGNPVFLTDDNFTKAMAEPRSYKFLKLFTPWCRYCRVLKEVIEQMKPMYDNRKDIRFYEINCHVSQNTCFGMQAFSFPFTVIFGPDGQLKDKIIGALPLPVMKEFLDRNTEQHFQEEENKETNPEEHKQDPKPEQLHIQKPPETPSPTQTEEAKNHELPKKQQPHREQPKIQESHPESKKGQAEPKKEQNHQKPPEIKQEQKAPEPQNVHQQPKAQQQQPVIHTNIHETVQKIVQPIVQPQKIQVHQPSPSLQNSQTTYSGASKFQALIYIAFGVMLGYFLHDIINKEHQRPQLPI